MIDNDYSPSISYAYGNVLRIVMTDSEPVTEPVTLTEAKLWLRIDAGEATFDAMVLEGITSARQQCENYLNVSLIRRTITASLQLPPYGMALPFAPVVGQLTSVTDEDGNAIIADSYKLADAVLTVEEYTDVVATYEAGYETCPAWAKTGIKRLLAWDWENRGDTGEVRNIGKITGLQPYRRLV